MNNQDKADEIANDLERCNFDKESAWQGAMNMAQWKDKQVLEKTLKWFQENLQPHTDWTGTRIETRFKCESLDELFNLFKKSMEE